MASSPSIQELLRVAQIADGDIGYVGIALGGAVAALALTLRASRVGTDKALETELFKVIHLPGGALSGTI